MAKQDKTAEKKPEVKTKEFPLKKPLGKKAIGDKVKLGPKGETFYKLNGTI